jgi:hypothetical protein
VNASLAPVSGNAQQLVLHVIPDRIGKEFNEFHQVFRVGRDGEYMLVVNSFSGVPIEVRDIVLHRLDNYSPFHLPGEAELSYRKIFDDGKFYVYRNDNLLPRAWSVGELVEGAGIEDIKNKLFAFKINPAEQAILSGDDIKRVGRTEFQKGEVRVQELGMNKVVLRTVFPDTGFVVLSDQHYPGWKAFVDGQETNIYKVNGLLRGVVVPQGEHSVVFKYRPNILLFLMALSLSVTALMIIYLVVRRRDDIHSPSGI